MLDGLFAIVGFVLIGAVIVLVVRLLTLVVGESGPVVGVIGGTLILALLLGGVYAYEVEFPLRWNGQTPGKRIVKIAIASLDPGVPLRRGQLTHRMLITQLFNVMTYCLVGYLDVLWCLWDKPYRQCLHDKGPKTVVVRVDPAGPR